jgi:predicted kinase
MKNYQGGFMIDRPTFKMLVGIPGSGKSTYAKLHINESTKHFSSDAIRKELWGDENCQQEPYKVFNLMHERVLDALKNGYDVIYDATNITRKSRRGIMNLLPAYVKTECVIVWASIEDCIKRDIERTRSVGEEVIMTMLKRFEAPFYDEGFDEIKLYRAESSFDSQEYYASCISDLYIPHDNPHHALGVYEHCQLCGKLLQDKNLPEVVKFAGFHHDIGKPLTKTFINMKGETTEVAHYYGHQAVGAWLSYGFPTATPTLAWLISTHMAPFINQKYYNSLDPLYKNWIDILHNADQAAH